MTFQEVLKKGEILANLAEADQTSEEPDNIVIIFQYNDINLDSCKQKNSVFKIKLPNFKTLTHSSAKYSALPVWKRVARSGEEEASRARYYSCRRVEGGPRRASEVADPCC